MPASNALALRSEPIIKGRAMRSLFLLLPPLFAGCATSYQPEGSSGGFSDLMTGPDTAMVTCSGNGYTSAQRVMAMITLRCADVTLQHGYRYFAVHRNSRFRHSVGRRCLGRGAACGGNSLLERLFYM